MNPLLQDSLIMLGLLILAALFIQSAVRLLTGQGIILKISLVYLVTIVIDTELAFILGKIGFSLVNCIITFGPGILATAGCIMVLFRLVVAPLQKLIAQGQQAAAGDVRDIAEQPSRDEIGQLAGVIREVVAYQRSMAAAASDLAGGNLAVEVSPKSELDVLGNAFARMIGSLRELVAQVRDNAQSVGQAAEGLAATANGAASSTDQISKTMRQVANGTTLQSEGVTKTAHSVAEMQRAIDGVAHGAQDQAEAVTRATTVMGRLSQAAEGIRQGAAAQAEGMERATAARTSLEGALRQVGNTTEQVAQEAQQAAKSAGDGVNLVTQTVDGIQKVRAATEQLAERVRGLGKQSAQIGSIIETIEDIASQTNLLALNAAIEAARAGEHGKGFAVVADEVRKLAERSSSATKETAEMIRNIQSEANEAVQAMGQAGADVTAAVRLSEQSGEAFRDIAEKSQGSARRIGSVREAVDAMARESMQLEKTVAEAVTITDRNRQAADSMGQLNNQMVESLDAMSAVVEENTAATEEMAAGSSEVAQAIESIASVSQENSAAVEEVTAASEEMSSQVAQVTAAAQALAEMAQALQAAVTQFKLEGEQNPALEKGAPAPRRKLAAASASRRASDQK